MKVFPLCVYCEQRFARFEGKNGAEVCLVCKGKQERGEDVIYPRKGARGLCDYAEFEDSNGNAIRVSDSSSAEEDACWVWCKNVEGKEDTPHLTVEQAQKMIAGLELFIAGVEGVSVEEAAPVELEKPALPLPKFCHLCDRRDSVGMTKRGNRICLECAVEHSRGFVPWALFDVMNRTQGAKS